MSTTSERPRYKTRGLTAKGADRHELYERSVQDTEADIHFIQRAFAKERGRKPLSLREDFCGTAKLCADWVHGHPERTATGLDLHQPTLDYAVKRHVGPLGEEASRVRLLHRNVLEGTRQKHDVVVAFNFSYCCFKQRSEMLRYFTRAREGLHNDGAFLLDMYGGPDAQIECVEPQRKGGFTYVWEQKPIDAVSGEGMRYIHFRFPDGTEINRAFSYDWRLWSLPELRDILQEAGFERIDVYWEGTGEDGEGNGIFRKVKRAENEQAWIAYVIAWR